MEKYDFSGWATRNNLRCSDGRVIMKDAFKDNDGKKVPLIWNHQHDDPFSVCGHAILENRDEGVYAYCKLNDTESGKAARMIVEHGDVCALSIYANKLQQQGSNVVHGVIRELSLVLAGANPGAYIESVIRHGEECEDEAIIYNDSEDDINLFHSEDDAETTEEDESASMEHACDPKKKKELEHSKEGAEENMAEEIKKPDGEKTVADVFNTLSEEQKTVVYALIGQALKDQSDDNKEDDEVKHNVFDQEDKTADNVLSHDAMSTILGDAKRYGSLKESFMQHADTYGIDQIDYLFPDAKNVTNQPQFIQRDTGWVQKVMRGVHHTPFSRIKSIFADITEDEARAKGYIKGKLKKEEVFSLLKRTTAPTTVYKKQKLDRDDVVDITDFDVVAWLKSEMRMMLDEELARAYLVGDGRLASDDDKINEQNIRPIWTDEALFTVNATFTAAANATADDVARQFIRSIIKARKNYKGSGNPTLYTTEDMLTDCLLLTDNEGRDLYDSVEKLTKKLRVSEIVTVPVMEGLTREVSGKTRNLLGILVNLSDYNVGADKGGAINMFDDFDIDYNQQKYLIETRCSGALTKPFSAIAVEMENPM